jgi:hypothetical protein
MQSAAFHRLLQFFRPQTFSLHKEAAIAEYVLVSDALFSRSVREEKAIKKGIEKIEDKENNRALQFVTEDTLEREGY